MFVYVDILFPDIPINALPILNNHFSFGIYLNLW